MMRLVNSQFILYLSLSLNTICSFAIIERFQPMFFFRSAIIKFWYLVDKIRTLHYSLSFIYRTRYLLEEINDKTERVIIRCRGTRTIIKTSLSSVISDNKMIAGLSSIQACMLGGYYGRILRASLEGRQALKKVKNMSFLLTNEKGRHQIVFLNRIGDVGYYDKKACCEFVEHPLAIVNNNHIISGFEPSQACYIGILAGISIEKMLSSDKGGRFNEQLSKKSPKLYVVK